MSMLDLLRRHTPWPSSSSPLATSPSASLLARPSSCSAIFHALRTDELGELETHEQQQHQHQQHHHALRRCAMSMRPTPTTTARGWGIVPVLNELERRSSTNTLLHRRSPRAQQAVCRNCRRLYFPSDSPCASPPASTEHQDSLRTTTTTSATAPGSFCSLDCQSSYTCNAATQELVDLELHGASPDASSISDEDTVITLDDDADFSF